MENSSLFIILHRMRMPFLVIIITYTISIIGLLLIEGVDEQGNPYHMGIFDAFYFVSYMATTIGFGEAPFEFNYSQRIWVTFSIYLTVLGWFYGIGSLVSLLQDKLFLQEIERAKFTRQIKNLKENFIIILGYNQITSEIIKKSLQQGIRTVVLEKDKNKINHLILESFTPTVPVLYSENYSLKALELAGIKKYNCKAIVSLFEDDALNLKISLIARLLNKHVKIAAKSTTTNHSENLKDLDVEIIANPFSIISSEVNMALVAPNLLKLEKWLYRIDNLSATLPSFPNGKYIICGYGRMGRKIYEKLKKNNIKAQLVEIDKNNINRFSKDEIEHINFGDADDKEILLEIGIKDSVAIIAATNDDTTNLSILATAKKLNPEIMTIVRENEMEDFSIFNNANIDHIFMPSKILINKTANALINPLSDKFIRLILKKDENWASKVVRKLVQEINENPILVEFSINEKYTPEIYRHLDEGNSLTLDILATSLHNKEQRNNVLPLLLQREDEVTLLPVFEHNLKIGDKILFACDEHAKDDIEYICQNIYEFHYALTGEEKQTIFKGKK
ncbi:potassium channel family protein [Poseidonibacter ostreae]|uniref:Potassium transporter TrkA n=1 Tax=Poseidonibacter ostreae TaxID=2654171 RepID=A0A6L4WPG5_9BACT|nr:NAD(P)-binding protein [Poseidonibacter ostreae]KAB7884597.1 potassium transporter TrkA [Poseidonibacter ostreae]KAB7885555.1 potassium transporter TrkA [Poseidonibacter ostreae]MAC84574.1 potassium transporter TrkA [Arcobacter sp.]